jgi:hypothetical protein
MFSLPTAVAAIIEDARRRQHRRRRGVAVVALGLAVIAGAGFFGSRQLGGHRHTVTSAKTVTSASFTYVTESGANGFTIRRVMPAANGAPGSGPITVVSGVTLRRTGNASVTLVLDPQTGLVHLETVKRHAPYGAPTITAR